MVENISVYHHLGTYPQYMVVSVFQLGEARVFGDYLLAEAQSFIFSLSRKLLLLCSLFDIYIIQNFNCQVKNYFWNA
jgi:hypothetical protein